MIIGAQAKLTEIIQRILRRSTRYQPTEATIFAIDGVRVDVQVLGSATLLRNVPVIGDTEELRPGQIVQLRWDHDLPIVVATTDGGAIPFSVTVQADDITLENSPIGVRVKAGGIRIWHLAFKPSLEGHTHKDIFELHGWSVTEDGAIYQNDTYIYPDGQISLGRGTGVIKLDSKHPEYRMWSGAIRPEDATFKVTADGKIIATAGSIAGWDILSDRLSKNDALIKSEGEIVLGTGDDVAVLSSVDPNNWRLWIGDEVPADAPFRVDKWGNVWIESGTIAMALQSDNYVQGLKGWKLFDDGLAEFENVIVRGRIETSVFAQATISTVSGQLLLTIGDVVGADVEDTDTSIDFQTDIFSVGDILHFKTGPSRVEWMKITAGPTIVGDLFRYDVERDLDGSGACDFYIGEVAARKGAGVVARDVQPLAAGVEGGEFGEYQPGGAGDSSGGGWLICDGESPFFGVNARFGPLWNQFSRVVQIGNLVGCPLEEYTEETWGAFFGDESTYMVYDQTTGLRIVFTGAAYDTSIDGTGLQAELLKLAKLGVTPDYEDGKARFWYEKDGSDLKVYVRMKDGATETEIELTGQDADTVDGMHAAEFAREGEYILATQVFS